MEKTDILTGNLTYKDIEFTFVFDKESLKLIIPKDKEEEVGAWFGTQIAPGVFIPRNIVYMDDLLLTGFCYETQSDIVFFTSQSTITKSALTLSFAIKTYIFYQRKKVCVARMSFMSPELDYIFNANKAVKSRSWTPEGVVNINTKDFENTTSDQHEFTLDEKSVKARFYISRFTNAELGQPPLELHSKMIFDFEATSDHAFLYRLKDVVQDFIQYLCYRENITLQEIELYTPCDHGGLEKCGRFYLVGNKEDELNVLKQKRNIQYDDVKDAVGKILDDIGANQLYLRHIPVSHKNGNVITPASFIMITTAFEWTFKKMYTRGIGLSAESLAAEREVTCYLTEYLNKSAKFLNKKVKNIYSFLINNVNYALTTLEYKINYAGTQYTDILQNLETRLYSQNGEEFNISKAAKRISKQRNAFAHGSLDQYFEKVTLLDITYLRHLVYAMQLRFYGVNDELIKNAIKSLFHLH